MSEWRVALRPEDFLSVEFRCPLCEKTATIQREAFEPPGATFLCPLCGGNLIPQTGEFKVLLGILGATTDFKDLKVVLVAKVTRQE